jgi:hypothetical protein
MKWHALKAVLIMSLLISCIVQSPKYTTLPKVVSLKLGMTREHVENILGVEPYNLKAYTDTSSVFIYVYRVSERRTLSFLVRQRNGQVKLGKYMQLFVGYSKSNEVISIESCTICPDNLVTKSKVNFEKLFDFVTVTLPVILIYVGLTK